MKLSQQYQSRKKLRILISEIKNINRFFLKCGKFRSLKNSFSEVNINMKMLTLQKNPRFLKLPKK